jgi:hypothetical protein
MIRGQFVPQIESTGRPKKYLDVLIWGTGWSGQNHRDFDEVEVLRVYLRSIQPSYCAVRFLVPTIHRETADLFDRLDVRFVSIEIHEAAPEFLKSIPDKELRDATKTALTCNADVLVTANPDWFPYIEELMDLGLSIVDSGFLKRRCEIFVRGHDVPWAFVHPIVDITWNGFYHFAEQHTLKRGLDFLYAAQRKNASTEAQEAGRSLVHNRLPNICFTRDRLLFYETQKMAAQRAGWKRQEFNFEVSYYLNFYYPLIFGGFDHIALLVNHCLKLGLSEKNVGATYQGFLDALKLKDPRLHSIFTDAKHVEFMKRVAALRHYASHRGSLAPAKLVDQPDREPTNEELDAEIAEAGADIVYRYMPQGELRDSLQGMVRYNFKMAHYEKGKVVDGVVLIEIDGKRGLITPLNDTSWNFQKFILFMDEILAQLEKSL